jgi:UDP-GlcNAc:undecaprenyl-phosphate/decaprenyl-phosphate GlcNAc-1-phosphate transferase
MDWGTDVKDLMWLALKAFLVCLILTPIFRDIFRSYGIVDKPDRRRKVHVYPIPRIGGIPIAIAYVVALYPFSTESQLLTEYLPLAWKMIPAAGLIFAIGLTDDLIGLKPWQKLLGQVAAAGLAFWAGVRVAGVAGFFPDHIWLSLPLTLFWLLACTNAFNLVDGLDGLAAGMGLVASLTMVVAALQAQNMQLAYASIPLVGALVAFLCYNFNPATVFLGDSGSMLIGFFLGCFGVVWAQKSATLVGMTVPLLAVAIPLLDVSLTILRRFLRNQPIFSADRGHIHHRLLDRGLAPSRAVLVLYLVCAAAAAFALLLTHPYAGFYYGPIVLVICIVALIGIRQLRYAEFGLASRLLFGGELQRTLGGQIRLEMLAEKLGGAQSEEDCWRVLAASIDDFGFAAVELSLRGHRWQKSIPGSLDSECWSLQVPISDQDWLRLKRPFATGVLPMMVTPFLDTVRRALQSKLQHWDSEAVL